MIDCEKLLRELVAVPSVNPAFLPSGHPRAGEQSVSAFLAALAKRAGLDVRTEPALPNRPNFLARLSPRSRVRQRVLLAPHLDTVNGAEEQFSPRTKNGRLYGRGSSDAKGTVAAMFSALCEVARSPKRPAHTEIVFAGLVDEENGQGGSRALASGGMTASLAIVGEPTRLKVITAHKGSVWIRIETRGKAAHGCRPELGRNAVETAAEICLLLQRDYAEKLAKRRHPLLGRPTVSVGVIQGGNQPNIVPDRCFLEVDRRTLPGETDEMVRREVRALLRGRGLNGGYVSTRLAPCLPLETDPGLPLVRQFLSVCGQRKPSGVDYYCDASVLAHAGLPSVVFGPGDIAQGHTTDEWIEVAQIEQAKNMLCRFLLSLS